MTWLWRIFRRVMTPTVPANVNPNPAPTGPTPIVKVKPDVPPAEPDLEFIGTRDLYSQIASRYDASMLICVRLTGKPDKSANFVFLANHVDNPSAFLQGILSQVQDADMREIREDDL